MDGGTPVLVGVGEVRLGSDPPPLESMLQLAVDAVVADAGPGGAGLLRAATWVGVPEGGWSHADPGRALLPSAHTVLARVGVLQQSVLDAAVQAVLDGAPAALVAGGEVAYGSSGGAARAVASARSGDAAPDELLETADFGISVLEFSSGLFDPPSVYALLESAWGAAHGWSVAEHRAQLAALQARFAAVAGIDAPDVSTPGPDNRMVAFPYTKLCCSNLRVNQSAALLFTTVDGARAAGVPEDRWVFPQAAAVGNHAVPVVQRPQLERSPNAEAVFAALPGAAAAAHVDLYSCFPVAVQIAAAVLGIEATTVTGGMTFAGGPLNSYSLHALVALAGRLRADPGSTGLLTSVSGFLTKYGASLWSSTPPSALWTATDVSATAEARCGDHHTEAEADALPGGPLTVVAATVEHARDGARRLVAVAEDGAGTRTVVHRTDDETIARVEAGELVGRRLAGGSERP